MGILQKNFDYSWAGAIYVDEFPWLHVSDQLPGTDRDFSRQWESADDA